MLKPHRFDPFSLPPPERPRRNRILVVDDDPGILAIFEQMLLQAHFDVVTADGGGRGLRVLRQDPTIGLLMLDLMMPEMDGWRLRHAQRADPKLATIPTIIVSGSPLRGIVHEELQAADYLLKPVGRDHLLSVVATYCKPSEEYSGPA